jgi:Icc-related predicted phosphoesterase
MKLFQSKNKPPAQATTSVYYASDLHGADRVWRKFLGAGRFYNADALILGGDLTGKAIIPVEQLGERSFRTEFLGEERRADSPERLEELFDAIRYNGMYPWLASPEEILRHRNDDAARNGLFNQVMTDELRRWISLADERMPRHGIDVLVMSGNDDPWECDEIIESADHVQACDDRIVRVGPHEMISCSYVNPTPWHSPRELDDNALYERINRLASQLENPRTAIFNLHVPPYDSGLDRAQKITEDLKPVFSSGHPVEIPVGSHAVRQIIEDYQPLVSLHGHIHESRAEALIGKTLSVNAGSEYNSGRIHGAVLELGRSEVVSHQFVVG